jgi:hypothetical protein
MTQLTFKKSKGINGMYLLYLQPKKNWTISVQVRSVLLDHVMS